ncbi:putative methyltransferase [uncultured Desulfobacterium sp.]|uniref:Ribosomal RNA small subunit methyltransferase I n=1 Tax=uncultured Desulfobacterium sp. TaxID=201089 RepID=A0A445MXL6_9BACT|nr:putative methyltransferase [uncultured Desulfobacterium sp.]
MTKSSFPKPRRTKSEVKTAGVQGTLYVVATPIGNLEDITLRALKVLNNVDIIAAEGVDHTRQLLRHYDIRTRLESYNQHNHKLKAPELLGHLNRGKDIAVVTDAGTPGISDPGVYLIGLAVDHGIRVTPIPGPSAVTSALSVSGLPSEQFVFLGFLPNRAGKRMMALKRLAFETRTMVFFEAPHRIRPMLNDLRGALGDRQMVMVREISKVFEETRHGPVSAILEGLTQEKTRGEFTLVVSGAKEDAVDSLSEGVLDRIESLLSDQDISTKDIAELISKEEGVSYRQIYKECVARRKGCLRKGLRREDEIQ